MPRIVIADDDREIVRLLRAYLEQAGYQVLPVYDGKTALHVLRRERPELLILDLMLPGLDGWEITRLVRRDASLAATPILMLTARVENRDKILGLEMGADDYITKPFNPREVTARVRAVLRRAHGEAPSRVLLVGQSPLLRIDLDRFEVLVGQNPVHLTPTEFGLLRALAEHPGRVLTRLELIERGLGYSYAGLERTIDSHIKNLRRKLAAGDSGLHLIETVFGVGYRLDPGSGA